MISRIISALIKALLFEYHDNVGRPNYRRLMDSLLKRFLWEKMTFDCKSHCQRYIVCNRAKPDRKGRVALQPLEIPEYPWKIVGIYYVTDIHRSYIDRYATVFIMVCLFTKIGHLVPCHKEIIT